jgi:signal transduction histidine kinase
MAAAARAMAAGDYGRRVTATSRDEVGELARAFNRMATELAEVDRMRRDLVANVSHELRTPITALQVVLENLVDGVEPPDPRTLATLLRQVERLGRLVEQLLELSRLESGGVPLEVAPFSVAPFLEQAAHEARLAAETAGADVRIVVDVDPPALQVDADVERVHQVVANLLDNALRHSPPGGQVIVRARPATGGAVDFEVTDEGPGIPAQDAERVFERFFRTDASRSAAIGGTGLGLAIARWVVDLHGGSIRADRNTPTGCRMVVHLPRRAA